MQEQMAILSSTVHSLANRDSIQPSDPTSQPPTGQRSFRPLSSAKELTFQGPTTFAFSFDLAKTSLRQRGIVERHDLGDGDMTQEPSPMPSPPSPDPGLDAGRSGDPLWTIGKPEALRLCRVYEEEMGVMYPVLELAQLLHQVHLLFDPMNSALWPRNSLQVNGDIDGLDATDVHILRLVFACALTAEGSGRSELAIRLSESVAGVADKCVWGPPEIKNIIFLTLLVRQYDPPRRWF